jgi:hypothetical protein
MNPLFDTDSSEYGRPETGSWSEEEVAGDRAETDPCERGTPGCAVRHTRDSECQTW